MSAVLRQWARALGGEVSGREVLCPGPGHGERDRSLAVRQSPNAPAGYMVHSHAGDDFRTCRDHVAALVGAPLFEPGQPRKLPVRIDKPAGPETSKSTSDLAALLWRRSEPILGTLGAAYLRAHRGFACALPCTMRFLPARGRHPGTLISAFATPRETEPGTMSMDGVEVRGVHLIRIAPDGAKLEKRMLGTTGGLPLAMVPWTETGRSLVLAEGPEDALSGHEATRAAAWAGGSAAHMAKLAPMVPSWVETITIVEDDNDAGRKATRTLAKALTARGFEVIVTEGAARD